MTEPNKKFIALWTVFIALFYLMLGYFYADETPELEPISVIEKPQGTMYVNNTQIQESIDENSDWWGALYSFFGTIFEMIVGLLKTIFFIFPDMPLEVTLVMNLLVNGINLYYLMNIYPYIQSIIEILLKIIDIIVPDWL